MQKLPQEGEDARQNLLDGLGRNLARLGEIPTKLDEVVSLIGTDHGGTKDNPHIVRYDLVIDLPDDFSERANIAIERFVMSFDDYN